MPYKTTQNTNQSFEVQKLDIIKTKINGVDGECNWRLFMKGIQPQFVDIFRWYKECASFEKAFRTKVIPCERYENENIRHMKAAKEATTKKTPKIGRKEAVFSKFTGAAMGQVLNFPLIGSVQKGTGAKRYYYDGEIAQGKVLFNNHRKLLTPCRNKGWIRKDRSMKYSSRDSTVYYANDELASLIKAHHPSHADYSDVLVTEPCLETLLPALDDFVNIRRSVDSTFMISTFSEDPCYLPRFCWIPHINSCSRMKLNWTAHPGISYSKVFKAENKDEAFNAALVIARYRHKIAARSFRRCTSPFMITGREKRKSLEYGDELKSRPIFIVETCMDLFHSLYMRPILNNIMMAEKDILLGWTRTSRSLREMDAFLSQGNVFSLDWSRFDSSLHADVMRCGMAILRQCYPPSRKLDKIWFYMTSHIVDKFVYLHDGSLWWFYGGMPSGVPWVAVLNSVCNYVMMKCILRKMLPDRWKEIKVRTYGDDVIGVCPADIKLNGKQIAHYAKHLFGGTIKSSSFRYTEPWCQEEERCVSFLSFKYRYGLWSWEDERMMQNIIVPKKGFDCGWYVKYHIQSMASYSLFNFSSINMVDLLLDHVSKNHVLDNTTLFAPKDMKVDHVEPTWHEAWLTETVSCYKVAQPPETTETFRQRRRLRDSRYEGVMVFGRVLHYINSLRDENTSINNSGTPANWMSKKVVRGKQKLDTLLQANLNVLGLSNDVIMKSGRTYHFKGKKQEELLSWGREQLKIFNRFVFPINSIDV